MTKFVAFHLRLKSILLSQSPCSTFATINAGHPKVAIDSHNHRSIPHCFSHFCIHFSLLLPFFHPWTHANPTQINIPPPAPLASRIIFFRCAPVSNFTSRQGKNDVTQAHALACRAIKPQQPPQRTAVLDRQGLDH